MTVTNIAKGVLLTTATNVITINELQDKLVQVKAIEYENSEAVTKKVSLKQSIGNVKRNNLRRQKIIFKLDIPLNTEAPELSK